MSTMPDGEMVRRFRENGGGDKPCQAGFKAAYADSEDEGAAHRVRALAERGGAG